MDQKLIKKYLEYTNSEEGLAVLFVKKHLSQAKGHWVDITDCRCYEMSSDNLHFRYVVGGIYKRKIQPKYPPKSNCTYNGRFNERQYHLMVRAITWEAAHEDIKRQKSKKIAPRKFNIRGVSYDENRDNKNFFREDAPEEIKALANNLNDRTSPLWDKALCYANEPEFVYKIRRIHID